MPKCIVCNEKRARLGKQQGFSEHLLCSQRCAVNHFFNTAMDAQLCEKCGEWTDNCVCPDAYTYDSAKLEAEAERGRGPAR